MIRNGHIPSSGRLACRFRVRRPAARNGLRSGGGDISTLNIGKRRKKTKRRLPKSSIIVMCSGCGGCPPCGRSPRSGPETSGIRCDTSTNIPIFAPVTEGHFTRENHGKGGIFRYRRYVGEFQDAQDAREHPKGAGGAPRGSRDVSASALRDEPDRAASCRVVSRGGIGRPRDQF